MPVYMRRPVCHALSANSCYFQACDIAEEFAKTFDVVFSEVVINDLKAAIRTAALTWATGDTVDAVINEPSKATKRKRVNETISTLEKAGGRESDLMDCLVTKIKIARQL